MSEENLFLPEDLDLTGEEMDKADERPELPEGITAYFRVVESANGEYSTGSLYNQLTVVPLRDPSDDQSGIRRYSMRCRTTVPKANPARPGHKAPDTKWIFDQTLRALYGTDVIPNRPTKAKSGHGFVFKGEIIDSQTAAQVKSEINKKIAEKGNEFWKNPESVVGMCFVGTTARDKKGYLQLVRLRPEPDADTPLTDLTDLE